MNVNKVEELIVLSKALNYIKFHCNEYDVRYLVGSPILGELYRKSTEELQEYYKSQGLKTPDFWPNIETLPQYLTVIEKHIQNTDNWIALEEELKISFVKDLIFPYSFWENTVSLLIEKGNEFHSSLKNANN